jgi:hypothetical protein
MASLRELIESAFVTHLGAAGLVATITGGMSGATKDAPSVVARVASVREEPQRSGNYEAECEIIVKSAGDITAHNTLCEAVRTSIWIDDLAAQLNASVAGLTVFGVMSPHEIDYDTDDDCWVETHKLSVYAAAHTFPA